MIKVCDCIMGSGKSSAAINYMNDHPGDKFIYITPYLDEAKRIKRACPRLKFVEPSNKMPEHQFKKRIHTAELIKKSRNIATTHQAFKTYDEEMLDDIRRQEYTLIIDESLDVLEEYGCHPEDVEMLINGGYIKEEYEVLMVTDKPYNGNMARSIVDFIKERDVMCFEGDNRIDLYYWILPYQLVTSFRDVFILTYMFEGQSIHHFLDFYSMKYEHMGVTIDEDGRHVFCKGESYIPEYVYELKSKIHILEQTKLNDIGRKRTALSKTWFSTDDRGVERLRCDVYNCMHNLWGGVSCNNKMWGTFKPYEAALKGKGYSSCFLVFNAKSTNEYRRKSHLIYAVNVFMDANQKRFYKKNGVQTNEDMYALSVMLQWIWRSGIRDGNDIHLYVPSSRMREMLIKWIDQVSQTRKEVA